MQNIFQSSEKLKNPWGRVPFKYETELSKLEIGESIAVEQALGTQDQIRMKIYRIGKRFGKKFRVIDHGGVMPYEVGRVS